MKKVLISITISLLTFTCQSQNWIWAKNPSGAARDEACGESCDKYGNVFVTGWYSSPTLTFDSITLVNSDPGGNYQDIFIAKYSPAGDIIWAKSIGREAEHDEGYAVSCDPFGNVFVTGWFASPTITFGAVTLTRGAEETLFIAKYDSNGNVLWAKRAGGSGFTLGESISCDNSGNVYITGIFSSSISFGSTYLTDGSLFIAKYDGAGNLMWAKDAGYNSACGWSVSTDPAGNVFVSGAFGGYTITFDTIVLSSSDGDAFVAKLDPNGNALWAKRIGGLKNDGGFSGSADHDGNVVVTGRFFSPTIILGSITLVNSDTSGNTSDVFLVKLDPLGNVIWATSAGGPNYDDGQAVSTDLYGNVFLSGVYASPSITFGPLSLTHPSSTVGLYLVKFDADGAVICATSWSGGGGDQNRIATDLYGNLYIGGGFSVDPFTLGTHDLSFTSTDPVLGLNVFIAKYNCENNVLTTISDETIASSEGISVFPNPSKGLFTVKLKNKAGETNICIRDVYGNCVLNKKTLANNEQAIDLSGRAKGIYFMELISAGEREVQKIVVQ